MLEKIRKNIALVIGGFTIVGGVVGGINTVGRLVDTLSGIDDRVSQLSIPDKYKEEDWDWIR